MSDDTYEEALERDARDLVSAARASELSPVYFRDAEVAAVLDQLDRDRSVLLVGPAGVGKTAVLHGVAKAMAAREVRDHLYEVSTALLLAGTRYIGEWQTKVLRVATAASELGAVLYITDIWNLPQVGRTSTNDNNMLDALRPFLESGRLIVAAEVTPETLRAMQRVPGFVRLFHPIEIHPLPPDKVDAAIELSAERAGARVDSSSRACLVKLTTRFLAARPQPGPALSLLAQVLDYQEQKRGIGELEPVSPAFVERVFSIMTGLPPFVVSREVTMSASEVRAWFAERIVGQSEAIGAVVEMIALFKAGLHDPSRPVGTFLFVGPTGVGKTELARALATFIFGSPQRLLRFDLSEFKDYSSFELLLGSPNDPAKPARLLDAVRAHPFQVVLFDELEKAHPNVWDLLLPLLDEGRLTAPGGDTVDFRSTVIIATSNVGAVEAQRPERPLGFGPSAGTPQRSEGEGRSMRMKGALEESFRPEFLNRFQHIILFHALSKEQMRLVARQEMARVLTREGISGRNLVVDVDDEAIDLVIEQGIDARFGARALKREIQRRLVLPLAMTLMERDVSPDSILKVTVKDGELRVRVLETEKSLVHRKELEPVRTPEGKTLTRADIAEQIRLAAERTEAVAAGVGEAQLVEERDRLSDVRNRPSFWKNIEEADRVQSDLDRVSATLDRLSRLREQIGEAQAALAKAASRGKLEEVAHRVRALEEATSEAERELLRMGWEGSWDALVEVRPVGAAGREARDMLVEVYTGWAQWKRHGVDWLREPREDDEPAMFAVKGLYAFGMLRGEGGLHRLRLPPPEGMREAQGKVVVAVVRVGAWTEARGTPVIVRQRPLKAVGQWGGKIRSRVECELGPVAPGTPGILVLQSGRTIAENTELAGEVAPSWAMARAAPEEVVRRYDRSPPLVRDALAGVSSGRPDALSPRSFDAMLKARVDAAPPVSLG
ncbi:MAG TPA: AAA family ATPase [Polyangiaceae bacterium]|nr:AAA family ATPase [Polyangiaceae bacterium]